jgi:hypothetical protein
MKFDKKGVILGAIIGAFTGIISGITNIGIIEKVLIATVTGIIIAIIMHLIWK